MRLKKVSDGCEYIFIHKFVMVEGFCGGYNTTYYKMGYKVIGYDIFYDDKTFHI